MSTVFELLVGVFVLLPGFLILRVRQRTTEYRSLAAFEFTTTSLAYSVLVFLVFITTSILLARLFPDQYRLDFAIELISETQIPTASRLRSFLTPVGLSVGWMYLVSAVLVALFVWNWSWLGITKKIARAVGVTRFSEHLTPWEDFFVLNRLNWVVVELGDGRSLVGKIAMFSHSPFDRQFMLQSPSSTGVEIYAPDQKKVNIGHRIEHIYVHANEIKTIQSIRDEKANVTVLGAGFYWKWLATLILAATAMLLVAVAPVLNSTGAFPHHLLLRFLFLVVALTAGFLNVWVLGRVS